MTTSKASTGRGRPAMWALAIGIVPVLAIVAAVWWILRPSWDERSAPQINGMVSEARQLVKQGRNRDAYTAYQRLFEFTAGRPPKRVVIRDTLAAARQEMQDAYARAKPEIDREAADQRERVRRQQERLAQEQAERSRAEAERRRSEAAKEEGERQAKVLEARRVREALARDAFKRSQDYHKLQAQADSVISTWRAEAVGEDSAYRSFSRASRANRDLLALYIKATAAMGGKKLDARVDRVVEKSDRDLVTEDLATRATYSNDKATLELLGLWCEVLSTPSLTEKYESERHKALMETLSDDSPPRAISRYSAANLRVLAAIVSAKGHGPAAASVLSRVQLVNAGEDSAWRAAMNNAEGTMQLWLALVDNENDPEVREIRSTVEMATAADESALRSQARYREAAMKSIRRAIRDLK